MEKIMNVKQLVLLFITLMTISSFAQTDSLDHRHSGIFQIGGQTIVSMHYEYSLIYKKHFQLITNVGFGLNEYADDQDPNDRPIYGLHSGLFTLIGAKWMYLELGVGPTIYKYKSTVFTNLNGWSGLRVVVVKEFCFVSAGYTPRLYTSFTDPSNSLNNIPVGVKIGIIF